MSGLSLNFAVVTASLRPKFALQLLFLLNVGGLHLQLCAQAAGPAAPVRNIHGIVKSGNMPIPGAGISATNTDTKEQFNTSTDVDGNYSLRIPADGHFIVKVQMTAFAAIERVAFGTGNRR